MSEYFTLGQGGVTLKSEPLRETREQAAEAADKYLRYNTSAPKVEILRVRIMVLDTIQSPYRNKMPNRDEYKNGPR